MPGTNRRVAIVVPLSTRSELLPSEETSLRHLRHYLGSYDRYVVAPAGLDVDLPDFRVRSFGPEYFGSVAAHTKLMLSRRFYESFADYEFILLYHLDALVFSERLQEWCDAGYDYIGAPWLKSEQSPEEGFAGVGNGGFSLRRVSSFLRVLSSRRLQMYPAEYREKYIARRSLPRRIAKRPGMYLKHLRYRNNVDWEVASFRRNEDGFWSIRAKHYDPSFRVAPTEVGLRFAFECAPRFCFDANGGQLPFGCHAWERYDAEFWRPHLLMEAGQEAGERRSVGSR